jgi:hypothetical protein
MSINFQILKDDEWIDIELKNLKRDDRFRLFEDGVLVRNNDGFSIFTAATDAYIDKTGMYQINVPKSITDWLMGR